MTRRRLGFKSWYLAVSLVSLLICQLDPTTIMAQDESAGTFGASYLKIPVGPALMTVPDVVVEMNPDASLAFSNPAALALLPRGHAFFSRAAWLDELSLNAASVVLPLSRYDMGFSFGTRLLQAGELRGFDSNNQVVSEDAYYGLALSGALSKQFSSLGVSLGLGVTYLRERLPKETGSGLSMSVGASYMKGAHHVGIFAQDLGGKIAFEGHDYPLDSRYVAGYGYGFNRGWGRLDVGTQLVVSRSDLKRVQFGAVYHLPRYFVLRGGLDRTFDAPTTAQLPVSAGFGVRLGTLMLDYAFTPQEYFENTHTFSLGVSFGGAGLAQKSSEPEMAATETPVPLSEPARPAVAAESPAKTPSPATAKAAPKSQTSFLIVAGSHTRIESAKAEARALQLVKVPAVAETEGKRFRVLVGRYPTRRAAEEALARYESQGHRFEIQPETP